MFLGKALVLIGGWLAGSWGALAVEWTTIQERGYLVVGVKPHFPPLSFMDSTRKWQGFEIDIAQELAKEMLGSPEKVRFVSLSNSDRLPALWNDRVDMVIAQVTVTGNRQRLVDFSPAYYLDSTYLIYPKTIPPTSKAKIGVLQGSTTIGVIQTQFPTATTVGINSYTQGWQALTSQKIDAFAGDGTAMIAWLQQNPGFELSKPLRSHSLAIALPRGLQYREFRQQVSQTLEKLKSQGWLHRRADFWGLP